MTDRERLVELMEKTDEECRHTKSCKACVGYGKGSMCMIHHIADKILADGWMRPPCKVGDSCYPLNASGTAFTCEEKISRIIISEKNIIIGYYEHWDYRNKCRKTDNWRLPLRTRILGKGVFLSEEEALKALKGGGQE